MKTSIGMRAGLGPLLLVGVLALAGCAHSAQELQAGRTQALQSDLSRALGDWRTAVDSGWFKSSAAAARDLVSRYDEVYARWGIEPDPLSHGLLTYALALAARVDRGTLSAEEASRLSAAMRADIDSAKGRLAEESGGPDAMLRWWAAHWRERGDRYAGTAAAPVRCEVTPGKDGRSRIGCL